MSVDKFVQWMTDQGFNLHPSAKVIRYEDQRGISLVATEKIKEDTILFVIPPQLVLGADTSGISKTAVGSDPKFLELSTWNQLILTLMWEWKQPDSKWRPYLDILPESLDTPLFWTPEELTWLKGTDVEGHIGFEEILADYREHVEPIINAHATLFDLTCHNFELYKRFGSIVAAYSFTKPDETVVMMPMADMLNHKTGSNNARLFMDDDEPREGTAPYEMKAICDVSADQELYNTYGELGNGELLRKYGFVEEPENNPFNIVEIPLNMVVDVCRKNQPERFEEKLEFLKQKKVLPPEDEEVFVFVLSDDGMSAEMDHVMRVFHMKPHEWNLWKIAYEAEVQVDGNDDSGDDSDDDGETENTRGGNGHGMDLGDAETGLDDQESVEGSDEHAHGAHQKDGEENEHNEEGEGDQQFTLIDGGHLRIGIDGIDDDESEDDEELQIENVNGLVASSCEVLQARLATYPTDLETDQKLLAECAEEPNKSNSTGTKFAATHAGDESKSSSTPSKRKAHSDDVNPRPLQKRKIGDSAESEDVPVPLGKHHRMALIIRISEKRILQKCLQSLTSTDE